MCLFEPFGDCVSVHVVCVGIFLSMQEVDELMYSLCKMYISVGEIKYLYICNNIYICVCVSSNS